jgi:putative membrane protein
MGNYGGNFMRQEKIIVGDLKPARGSLLRLFTSWLIIALGVLIASLIIPGISYGDNAATLVIAVIVLSLLNLVLKPLLILFTLPFVVLTMGLGILIINALLFMLTGALVPGFEVTSFWSALGGAVIVSLTMIGVNLILSPPIKVQRTRVIGGSDRSPAHRRDDDAIDI